MSGKIRLDQRLLELELAESRSQAAGLILAGLVKVNQRVQTKAGAQVKAEDNIEVTKPLHPYVSRGGVKLAGALKEFGLAPDGFVCLDVGASTGGFTDCLLQHGAARVVTIDVGYGQLAHKLRQDERVEAHERINARQLPPELAPGPFDLIVADVSFISLTLIIPNLLDRLQEGGKLLCLVKPQFEVGRELVEKGGVVRDEKIRQSALTKIKKFVVAQGLTPLASCESVIAGPMGNREFLLLCAKQAYAC